MEISSSMMDPCLGFFGGKSSHRGLGRGHSGPSDNEDWHRVQTNGVPLPGRRRFLLGDGALIGGVRAGIHSKGGDARLFGVTTGASLKE